jgi:hypothetical protein
MAKCVKLHGQDEIIRVSDEEAHTIVSVEKKGVYYDKTAWRTWRKHVKEKAATRKVIDSRYLDPTTSNSGME